MQQLCLCLYPGYLISPVLLNTCGWLEKYLSWRLSQIRTASRAATMALSTLLLKAWSCVLSISRLLRLQVIFYVLSLRVFRTPFCVQDIYSQNVYVYNQVNSCHVQFFRKYSKYIHKQGHIYKQLCLFNRFILAAQQIDRSRNSRHVSVLSPIICFSYCNTILGSQSCAEDALRIFVSFQRSSKL